jgi:hypothetical protein
MDLHSYLVLRNTLLMLLWSLVAWIPPSALLPCPRKQLPSALWRRLFKLFRLVWWMCNASTALTDLWFQHSQMKPRFHHLLLLQCDWEIHRHVCGIVKKKSKPKLFSAFCAHPWAFSEPFLRKTCNNLAWDNIIENSTWNLWKFTRKFCNYEALSLILNKITTHYRWPTTSLFIVNICSPIFEHCS